MEMGQSAHTSTIWQEKIDEVEYGTFWHPNEKERFFPLLFHYHNGAVCALWLPAAVLAGGGGEDSGESPERGHGKPGRETAGRPAGEPAVHCVGRGHTLAGGGAGALSRGQEHHGFLPAHGAGYQRGGGTYDAGGALWLRGQTAAKRGGGGGHRADSEPAGFYGREWRAVIGGRHRGAATRLPLAPARSTSPSPRGTRCWTAPRSTPT